MQLSLLTFLSMLAFAGNSILCRLALMERHIDPLSFTTLRLASGALVLFALARFSSRQASTNTSKPASTSPRQPGSWTGAIALVLYAVTFSLAYVNMESGVGALVLFGSVQLTMLLYGMIKGERPTVLSMAGLVISIFGLVLLLLPGSSAPPLNAAALMAVAGAAWGWYSILGKGAVNPLASTANNFGRAIPLCLVIAVPWFATLHWDAPGVAYAILSGSVTSGLGYVVWYGVMAKLAVLKASTVQLSVPVLTAIMGATLLDETLTLQLITSCTLVLGGIAIVLVSKGRHQNDI